MLWLALSVLYLPGLERYVCCMYNMRKKAERTIIIACQFLGSNTYRFIYILELWNYFRSWDLVVPLSPSFCSTLCYCYHYIPRLIWYVYPGPQILSCLECISLSFLVLISKRRMIGDYSPTYLLILPIPTGTPRAVPEGVQSAIIE